MLMAKVVGSVVSTQKDETLVGKKLMIIQPINAERQDIRFHVLLTSGSSARKLFSTPSDAVDYAIVGIIDTFDF